MFRFSLKSLFIFITILSISGGWITFCINNRRCSLAIAGMGEKDIEDQFVYGPYFPFEGKTWQDIGIWRIYEDDAVTNRYWSESWGPRTSCHNLYLQEEVLQPIEFYGLKSFFKQDETHVYEPLNYYVYKTGKIFDFLPLTYIDFFEKTRYRKNKDGTKSYE